MAQITIPFFSTTKADLLKAAFSKIKFEALTFPGAPMLTDLRIGSTRTVWAK